MTQAHPSPAHMAKTDAPLLQVKDLVREYTLPREHLFQPPGKVHALNGVSFSVEKGRVLGIVGESGCGKSVTSLSSMGLLDPVTARVEGGEILFHGQDLLQYSPEQMRKIRGDRISMIFQEPMTSLNPVLTVGYQIEETLRLAGDNKSEAARRLGITRATLHNKLRKYGLE